MRVLGVKEQGRVYCFAGEYFYLIEETLFAWQCCKAQKFMIWSPYMHDMGERYIEIPYDY